MNDIMDSKEKYPIVRVFTTELGCIVSDDRFTEFKNASVTEDSGRITVESETEKMVYLHSQRITQILYIKKMDA